VAILAAVLIGYRAFTRAATAPTLVPLALFAAGALPAYAFFEGHPFRVRYMTMTVVACAVWAGVGIGTLRMFAGRSVVMVGGVVLVLAALAESPPWNLHAPLIEEARADLPRSRERLAVTACLRDGYAGERVFASMASLAHYMHELSNEGFAIADFVHEGNGPLWFDGLARGAARQAGWMLVEEQSEGGDVLARRLQDDPHFARGMTRVCEGGGVALYKRATESERHGENQAP
jgi:hypothetical protein